MFDTNQFKRAVKDWVRDHPTASVTELNDYCEELIPAPQYQSHNWLIEQTLGWYQHMLMTRKSRTWQDASQEEE
jgi:hypothetical protein